MAIEQVTQNRAKAAKEAKRTTAMDIEVETSMATSVSKLKEALNDSTSRQRGTDRRNKTAKPHKNKESLHKSLYRRSNFSSSPKCKWNSGRNRSRQVRKATHKAKIKEERQAEKRVEHEKEDPIQVGRSDKRNALALSASRTTREINSYARNLALHKFVPSSIATPLLWIVY
ncbi:uncharacterized protein PHALS_08902 [Plasmopara halstedii]|uniref:Uncharacterized protein n=1 Tax=Plasmopara halstedii TaxID=4781 RepID=A0A0P1AEP0_PLAHL|nr:uncharacterized protein PHALS_08902 [Plasmopara halstedii]CEG38852.1 hypothetical protein PHALS_08902 [Plasmopara halstedii]|eukprot:XP_024575221.1 hypothetical protein PHALS_08902 [Plasmopara halstedii]